MASTLYQPLERATREIRLVSVARCSKASNSKPIECQYNVFKLDDAPPYHALSYTWGDPTITTPIHLNGVEIRVTDNLHFALRRIRQLEEVRYVWIDAICINQSEISEKNHQVGLMGSIYSMAESVIVCLGDDADDSELALATLKEWSGALSTSVITFGSASRYLGITTDSSEILKSIPDPFARRKWVALQHFFERPYWRRIWILQEVSLGREVRIYCGSSMDFILWTSLSLITRFWSTVFTDPDSMVSDDENWTSVTNVYLGFVQRNLRSLMAVTSSGQDLDLYSLVHLTTLSAASNPLDKIYGLINLIPPQHWVLVPDYGLEPARLYRDFVLTEIERSSRIDVICLHQPDQRLRITPHLPSWVPDLHPYDNSKPIPLGGISARMKGEVDAGPGASLWKFCVNLGELSLRGIRCGKVIHSDSGSLTRNPHSPLDRRLDLVISATTESSTSIVSPIQRVFWSVILNQWRNAPIRHTSISRPKYFTLIFYLYGFLDHLPHLQLPYPKDTWQLISDFAEIFALVPGFWSSLCLMVDLMEATSLDTSQLIRLVWQTRSKSHTLSGAAKLSRGYTFIPKDIIRHTLNLSEDHKSWALWEVKKSLDIFSSQGFMILEEGSIGVGAIEVQVDDLVCVFPGLRAPAVLRAEEDHWVLIGDCFVHGMMHGEIIEEEENGKRKSEVFKIR